MNARTARAAVLEALASPVRQELVSHLGDGPATVTEIAQRLGRTRQSLYYHVLALERAGLVRKFGTRGEGRAAERLYAVADGPAPMRGRSLDARERAAVARATAAMLRLTQREVVAATQRTAARAGGRRTAVVAVRAKARLDARTLARVRRLLDQLVGIFRAAKGRHRDQPPCALTMVLTPARQSAPANPRTKTRPPRRAS
jgi:DNA-binding transcriptional ArsR family regulator